MIKILSQGFKAYKWLFALSAIAAVFTTTFDISGVYGNLLSALSIIVGFFVNVIVLMYNLVSQADKDTSDEMYEVIKNTYFRTAALIIAGSLNILIIIVSNITYSNNNSLLSYFYVLFKHNPGIHFLHYIYIFINFFTLSISYAFFIILIDVVYRIIKMYDDLMNKSN